MLANPKSIRAFIGAKDYTISREFYLELGFSEFKTSKTMSYFSLGAFGFYLQDYYEKDWIDNTMLFLEVENLEEQYKSIKSLMLDKSYPSVRLKEIVHNDWGAEFFLHDPSGVLWHIGRFL